MKIACVGSAPSSVALAPYQDASFDKFTQGVPPAQYPPQAHIDEEWEIWACSPGAYGCALRATRWFEVHRWEPGKEWFSPQYVQFLQQFRGPVYTGCAIPEIKNHVIYPLDKVEDEFSAFFLTSSLSLMAAMAIQEIMEARQAPGHNDADDVIGFWGVDMSATEEYGYQRAGCQFFVLEALRRGIGIYLPPESDLLQPLPVYGLCEHDHAYIKLTARARELSGRNQAANAAVAKATAEVHMTGGALSDLDYMVKTWVSPYGLQAGQVLRREPDCAPTPKRVPAGAEQVATPEGDKGPSTMDESMQIGRNNLA